MIHPTNLDLLPSDDRRELLVAYLDGELPAEQALHVSTWLDENPGALRELEHLRHAWDLLDHYEDEPVPPEFAGRVFDAVGLHHEAREGTVLRMAWYRRPLATAAAVLVAVGATAFVMRAGPSAGVSVPTRTVDVVSVLQDVPEDQLSALLLNADALLSVDAESLSVDAESFEAELGDETVLGG